MQEFSEPESREFIPWFELQWGIRFDSICNEFDIQGSPERTVSRAVIRDRKGHFYFVEKFSHQKFNLRNKVARAVDYLNRNGLSQALAYKQNRDADFLPFYKGACFQVSDFLDSSGIKQPDYLMSAVMGEGFARFLTSLSKASEGIEKEMRFTPFSIKQYIYQLFEQMNRHDPNEYKRFRPILAFLEKEFMTIHDQLPVGFCHGDLHPLNVIWNGELIAAVIDWEFTGMKPDIYDVANLVGCAGIEDPNGFGMPMVMRFIQQLRAENLFSDMGWRYFPEYLLALRFAWLSEWLRKKDREMIEMELAYMKILMENMDVMRLGWQL